MAWIRSLTAAVALTLAVPVAAAAPMRSIPLVVPFAVQVKGAALELDISVREERRYTFAVQLGFGDDELRQRVSRLAGNGARRADGTPVGTGVPIPVKLSVYRLPLADAAVYNERLADHELQAHSATYYKKRLAYIVLGPGEYRVRVEALQDVPELRGVPTKFEISYRQK